MKKIAHLTSAHTRYDTRIFLKECVSLAAYGFSVSLVVADGNNDEQKNNVFIYDVGASKGRLDRMRNTTKLVFNKAVEIDADIYHFHDPELIPIALRLKKLGKFVVYDIHEMTRLQILSKRWIPKYIRNTLSFIFSKYEDYACRKFDYLLVPQEEMRVSFSMLANCQTIFNYPEANYSIKDFKRSRYNLIYSGGISEERGLFNYIRLIEKITELDSRYNLILACKITPFVAELVSKSKANKSIQLVGYLDFDTLLNRYYSCAFGLILFNNVGQYYMANALKLFEYMRSGLVVIMPDFGHWVDFNKNNDAGFNVSVSDPDNIADLILNTTDVVIEKISLNNISVSKEKFSWESESLKLIQVYKKILGVENV